MEFISIEEYLYRIDGIWEFEKFHIVEVGLRKGIVLGIENVHRGSWPWTLGVFRGLPYPKCFNPKKRVALQ